MRKKLEEIVGQRLEFIATIGKFGFTLGNKVKQQTILLLDIKIHSSYSEQSLSSNLISSIITNHCWVIMQKSLQKVFKKLKLKRGQLIKFSSLVVEYVKSTRVNGAYVYIKDYKLDKLRGIKLIC